MKESKVITFIGGFYIFGGIIILLSLIFNGSALNIAFDLPNVPDYIVKLIVSLIYIPLGYLYINRIKNSNWVVLVLAIIFGCISASLTTKYNTQPFIGNLVYSCFVIVMTFLKRKEFKNGLKTLLKK
ncbi:MAG TPA: hypothetical protein IAB56_02415 [Candidatus Scybalousia intestinigallinarum]|nr:hypothetical protein [Candidatus Faecimonas gallistercoris]HIT21812.1 hypothetical protein [Candidatus Scybalousia intestinigallinarum]